MKGAPISPRYACPQSRSVFKDVLGERDDTRMIPIVVVTRMDARDLNPADFACIISKPVTMDTLLNAVGRCIGQSARQNHLAIALRIIHRL